MEVRIFEDFKVTINHALEIQRYPLKIIEYFHTKLDDGQIYPRNNINNLRSYTHTRLPYGVTNIPFTYKQLIEK